MWLPPLQGITLTCEFPLNSRSVTRNDATVSFSEANTRVGTDTSGALALVIAVSALTVRRQVDRVRRRFHVVFGACVALVLASGARDPESAWFALSSVLPALALIWFVSRFNLFGVLIGRRSFFVLTLAAVSSLYLFAVRRIADFVSFEVEALSGLVEVALIFGAAAVEAAALGLPARPHLAMLAAMLAASLPLAPLAAGAGLRAAAE
mgnify:CR=1 FL=1